MVIERIALAAGVAALLAFTSTGSTQVEEGQSPESKETCCFTNPAYSGVCKVQPAEDETCASILAYLNNPMAQGKSYCGGTKVPARVGGGGLRGGRVLGDEGVNDRTLLAELSCGTCQPSHHSRVRTNASPAALAARRLRKCPIAR